MKHGRDLDHKVDDDVMLKNAINVVLGWLKDAAISGNYPELTKLSKECPELLIPIN